MELSLDLCLAYVPKTVSEFLREVSGIRDRSEKMVRIEDYVSRLEDEMRKIDAFKRELPLCMLLLNDAIERLKEELVQCADSQARALTAGFSPAKDDSGEKRDWMSSAQLWGCEINEQESNPELNLIQRSEQEDRSEKLEFASFGEDKKASQVVSGLCLEIPVPESVTCDEKSRFGGSESAVFEEKVKPPPQGTRKQRRCWSPELHRRFVDSLHRLGGPKVATPKQIRELMQVDGLTNDEVKSHLQKYRLHIRKLPGSWIDKDRCGESSSGSPQGPLCRLKGISSNGDESVEAEEDDKTEGHSWGGGLGGGDGVAA